MKKVAVILTFLFGCNESETQKQQNVKVYGSMSLDIKVIKIDSCEYVIAQTGYRDGGVSITHKQNCKNHEKSTLQTIK